MTNTVLLTRPLHDSLAMQAILQSDNINSLIAPMLVIQPTNDVVAQFKAVAPGDMSAIVASSRHGFTALPAMRDYLDVPIFAVGEQTAAAAVAQGWHPPQHVSPTSRMLIPHLKSHNKPGKMIYLRGEIVSTDLSHHLDDRDWVNILAYKALATSHLSDTIIHAMEEGRINMVTFFSLRSAQLFEETMKQVKVSPKPMSAICLSEAIRDDLKGDYWAQKLTADQPSQSNLIQLVKQVHAGN